MEGQQLWEYCNKTTGVEKYFCVDSRNNGLAEKIILLLQTCKPPQQNGALFPVIRCRLFW